MANGNRTSTIDGLRALTLKIDRSLESLLEAHGFAFAGITTGETQCGALFSGPERAGKPTWMLTITLACDNHLSVDLSLAGEASSPAVTLTVHTDGTIIRTPAEAIGLAVCLVSLAPQLENRP